MLVGNTNECCGGLRWWVAQKFTARLCWGGLGPYAICWSFVRRALAVVCWTVTGLSRMVLAGLMRWAALISSAALLLWVSEERRWLVSRFCISAAIGCQRPSNLGLK